jgi:WhiB family redox-sensing transcriptional regulator
MLNVSWKKQAACSGADTSWFVPNEDEYITFAYKDRAIAFCKACPVREECLRYAYEENIQHGIYGGMTNKERRKYRFQWKGGNRDFFNNAR